MPKNHPSKQKRARKTKVKEESILFDGYWPDETPDVFLSRESKKKIKIEDSTSEGTSKLVSRPQPRKSELGLRQFVQNLPPPLEPTEKRKSIERYVQKREKRRYDRPKIEMISKIAKGKDRDSFGRFIEQDLLIYPDRSNLENKSDNSQGTLPFDIELEKRFADILNSFGRFRK
jgi:hypothetical protein